MLWANPFDPVLASANLPRPPKVLRLLASPGADPVGLRDRALLELLGPGLAPGACAALDLADLDPSQGMLRYPGRQVERFCIGLHET